MMKNEVINVALYIRVSSEEQVKYGYSLEAQEERLTDYCKHNNYKIIDKYIDEGKSARTKLSRRKELLELLENVKKGKFQRIIIWKLDRWSRNVADYYEIQKILDDNKVTWECTDEQYNTNTAMGRYMLNLKLSDAQNESDKTSERIKFNFECMLRNKRPIFGKQCLPLGYTIIGEDRDKRIVKDEGKEKMVLDMFDFFENTRNLRKTYRFMIDKHNLNVSFDSFRKYFKKTMYYGSYREIEDYCPAYISKERWDNIQGILKKNIKENKIKYDYLFSGLIKCRYCNYTMSGATHRSIWTRKDGTKKHWDNPTYRCNRHHFDPKSCPNSKAVNEKKLEKWLLNNFNNCLQEEINQVERAEEERKKQVKKVDINKIKNKLDRLNELYIDGKITKEKYNDDYKKYIEQIQETKIKKEKTRDLSCYKRILKDNTYLDVYNKLNNNSKRLFWNKYIDHIIQDDENDFKIFFK